MEKEKRDHPVLMKIFDRIIKIECLQARIYSVYTECTLDLQAVYTNIFAF